MFIHNSVIFLVLVSAITAGRHSGYDPTDSFGTFYSEEITTNEFLARRSESLWGNMDGDFGGKSSSNRKLNVFDLM